MSQSFLIAAGPSGGHIHPALAVAESLRRAAPEARIHLIHPGGAVAKRVLSKKKPQKGFFFHEIPLSGGLAGGQSALARLNVLIRLPFVFLQCLWLAFKIRPQAVFGAGGAITGPAVLAGVFFGKLFYISVWLLLLFGAARLFWEGLFLHLGYGLACIALVWFFVRDVRAWLRSPTDFSFAAEKASAFRSAIWEGNSQPGLTNRLLAPFVDKVFAVFPDLKGISAKQRVLCGYPLRRDIQRAAQALPAERAAEDQPQKAFSKPSPLKGASEPELLDSNQKNLLKSGKPDTGKAGIPEPAEKNIFADGKLRGKFNVLVLGGSQGSSLLNRAVSEALQDEGWRRDIFIHHQTGERDFPSVQKQCAGIKGARAFGFSFQIENDCRGSDLIFSRAGSGAIWEIAAFEKPLVLIPLAHSAGGHQRKNAEFMREKGLAEVIPESQFTAQAFKDMILSLKKNKSRRGALAKALRAASLEGGAGEIAKWLAKSPSGDKAAGRQPPPEKKSLELSQPG